MSFSKKALLAWSFLILTSCNHLLYPADRQPYFAQNSIKPVPQDVYIPIVEDDKKSFLHAWYFSAQSEIKKKRLIVHFHGNGQNLTTHFLFFRWMIDYGYDYLIFDYRGYGASSDDSASQKKTVEDGEAIFKYVHDNFKQDQIIAIGQSLGSNVLIRTLQELNEKNLRQYLPKVVVLDSSFLSYQSAASSVLSQRWFLYPLKPFAYLTVSDEWSAEKKIQSTPKLPAIFFHGTADTIIKYEMGKKAYDLWPGPKIFSDQIDGGHTSAFSDRRFLKSLPLLLTCIDQSFKPADLLENCLKTQ